MPLCKQDDRLPVLLGSAGLLVAGTIAVAVKFWSVFTLSVYKSNASYVAVSSKNGHS